MFHNMRSSSCSESRRSVVDIRRGEERDANVDKWVGNGDRERVLG